MITREDLKYKIESIFTRKELNSLYKIEDFNYNMYDDSNSKLETLYRYAYNIDIKPVCKVCGKPVEFIHKNGKLFRTYCSNECKIKDTNLVERHKQGCLKKYGVENISQLEDIKQKKEQTFLQHFGTKNNLGRKEVIKTIYNKYGVENISQLESIKKKKQETCFNHFGVNYGIQLSYARELRKRPESIQKEYETKKKNGTIGNQISSNEIIIYNELLKVFHNVIQQYISPLYPYKCDFYIPELDLYIEYNGFWTHGGKPYENNNEDNEILELWKTKNTEFYNAAIYNWTITDVNKRNTAKDNNLNYLEIWDEINENNVNKLIEYIKDNFSYSYSIPANISQFKDEIEYYKAVKGNLNKSYTNSNIVKYFQQNIFYAVEKQILSNEEKRNILINNRRKYLNKDIFTCEELINGIKLSHMYYGFSHFNPLWFKWFIEKYNIKTCYDPCGGWGHRLLGGLNLDLYIYNDLSTTTYNNVNKIIKYFNISNTITYNNDANIFTPLEYFEAMFTCPPYYNIEHYECGDFKDIDEYYMLIDNLFNCFHNSSAKIFGIVIREDLLKYDNYIEKIDITPNKANHMHKNNNKKYKEYLYIFTKKH